MNRKILQIAVPSIISNITVPLLGLVDVAIVGHLGNAVYIGAIAVGGMLFNILYWLFGFFRMGTSGMTSQALGRRDFTEVTQVLMRSLMIAILVALLLVSLQGPICRLAFTFIDASPEVQHFATIYFRICIFGAPAVLGLYGFIGWFIGMQNSRFPMAIAIAQNIINIAVSLTLVYALKMKLEGVAFGTLAAQYCGLAMAVFLYLRFYFRHKRSFLWKEVFNVEAMKHFFSVNSNIFFRTLFLVSVMCFFTAMGAHEGDMILAVNTLLMQFFTIFSYIMDGFAYAGEALSGRFIGAQNSSSLRELVQMIFRWGFVIAILFTSVYLFFGKPFLNLLTNDTETIQESMNYFYWILIIPLSSFAAFLWDGIFIGATRTRDMMFSSMIAAICFFLLFYSLFPIWGNHALWLSFILYLLLRGIVQTYLWARKKYQFY